MTQEESFEPNYRVDLTEEQNLWLTRFAPLLEEQEFLLADDLRSRIKLIRSLRSEAQDLIQKDSESQLSHTFFSAHVQLDSLEQEAREQLHRIAPGDPLGLVEMDKLQERLAEREARLELGVSALEIDPILRAQTGYASLTQAVFPILFSLGWNGFTLFHATLMIGGMWQAVGAFSLLLLLFYSLFFAVGYAMWSAGLGMLVNESIEISGSFLTVKKQRFSKIKSATYTLHRESIAKVIDNPSKNVKSGTNFGGNHRIEIRDVDGKSVMFGARLSKPEQDDLVEKINLYIKTQIDN